MEKDMLEQIQQMITTATVSLRREIVGDLRQEMIGMKAELRQEMAGMKVELRQEIASSAAGLREDIADGKRYAGILAEDLQHKLELVIVGQQFVRQDITNVRSDMDTQTRETRTIIGSVYNQLNDRIERHEQSRHP